MPGAVSRPLVGNAAEEITMSGMVALVLVLLWVLGIVTAYTIGGLLHVLPALAVVVVLLGWFAGRRSLQRGTAATSARLRGGNA